MKERKHINLALQGGGSHGAFTWGVLDRLLEDERLEFAGISGTSAGAMNAVALAAGLMEGGRAGAREALRRFWSAVAKSAHFGPMQRGFETLFGAATWPDSPWQLYAEMVSSVFSPYQTNPLNLNPLRDILNSTIDFERVRACDKTRLFIATTRVSDGRLKVFRHPEVSVEAVLASACLPLMFQAVEIDGEAYWDGGYTGNPALFPLIGESTAEDLLLVQLNPRRHVGVPRSAPQILDRVNELTFNISLLKELHAIAMMKQLMGDLAPDGRSERHTFFRKVHALRLHRIDSDEELAGMDASSKLQTGWTFLSSLHAAGRAAADEWLLHNFSHLGRRSTLDLEVEFAGF